MDGVAAGATPKRRNAHRRRREAFVHTTPSAPRSPAPPSPESISMAPTVAAITKPMKYGSFTTVPTTGIHFYNFLDETVLVSGSQRDDECFINVNAVGKTKYNFPAPFPTGSLITKATRVKPKTWFTFEGDHSAHWTGITVPVD